MLMKPSIIKMPNSFFPVNGKVRGCSNSGYTDGNGNKCSNTFTCSSSYSGGCIDSYSCSSNLAGGVLITGAVAYTAGIFITGAVVT